MNKQKLNIKQWSKADRPREKMMTKGSEALSDAELLGILIGSGNTEESAVELMRRILATCDNNLNELGKWEVRNFSSFKGMGPAKSLTIMAALELGKRRKLQESKEREQIRCSEDIYKLFHPLMCSNIHCSTFHRPVHFQTLHAGQLIYNPIIRAHDGHCLLPHFRLILFYPQKSW